MATRDELAALKSKIEGWSDLTAGERRFLMGVVEHASRDVISDDDLDKVAGGVPKGWVQAGCFG